MRSITAHCGPIVHTDPINTNCKIYSRFGTGHIDSVSHGESVSDSSARFYHGTVGTDMHGALGTSLLETA